jgi:hypothetical protein
MNNKIIVLSLAVAFLGSLLLMLITTYHHDYTAYGLMTKEKLAELIKEKNEQEGIIIQQEPTAESEPKTSHEKIQKLLNENKEREKILTELTNNTNSTKYQTYEERFLE